MQIRQSVRPACRHALGKEAGGSRALALLTGDHVGTDPAVEPPGHQRPLQAQRPAQCLTDLGQGEHAGEGSRAEQRVAAAARTSLSGRAGVLPGRGAPAGSWHARPCAPHALQTCKPRVPGLLLRLGWQAGQHAPMPDTSCMAEAFWGLKGSGSSGPAWPLERHCRCHHRCHSRPRWPRAGHIPPLPPPRTFLGTSSARASVSSCTQNAAAAPSHVRVLGPQTLLWRRRAGHGLGGAGGAGGALGLRLSASAGLVRGLAADIEPGCQRLHCLPAQQTERAPAQVR